MAFYQFHKEQFLPASIDDVWDFISSPANLKEITPDYMGFEVLSEGLEDKMYAGMIISYKVKPVFSIPTLWVTEITQIKEKAFFIDEQRVGPYKIWHHQHHIEEVDGGILMKDIISYSPPFGFLGSLANKFLIKSKLNEIFDYRKIALEKRFAK